MNESKTRARVHELAALVTQWEAFAFRAAKDGHQMDAQQHMRRANEARYEANKLKQTLNATS